MPRTLIPLLIFTLFIPEMMTAQSQRRFVAEWEPAWGTLIRWPLGIPSTLVAELAASDTLYVLVESYYERDQAISSFQSWNVNMANCRFLFAATYSHWTRDWGPHTVFNEQGLAAIADPVFNGYPWVAGCSSDQTQSNPSFFKGYEEDDAVNAILADTFDVPVIGLPVFLTGGNIMVDGHGTAISTQQMIDENIPVGNEDYFMQIAHDSLGISNYIIVDNPEVFGIQHIDCYAKFLNETTILVKQVDSWNPEFACCEALAAHLENELNCWGQPYQIVRIYCGAYNGSQVAAYTNSLILNNKVLVPLFGIASDAQALQTYQQAMPGYQVTGYDYANWYYYDALHCRTMGIFDKHMLHIAHQPLEGDITYNGTPPVVALINEHSQQGINPEQTLFHWREEGSDEWQHEPMIPMEATDSFFAFVPYPEVGKTYQYFISAGDSTGRYETRPMMAPEVFYSFKIADITSAINTAVINPNLLIVPACFSNYTTMHLNGALMEELSIYNSNGQQVWHEDFGKHPAGRFTWNTSNQQGHPCPAGVYLVNVKSGNKLHTAKCILTR